MSPFSSILVPLDGSPASVASLGCAFWLCKRLGSRLHVLSAVPEPSSPSEELARLGVPEECRPGLVFHQVQGRPEDAILVALSRQRAGLVVISARGAEGDKEEADPAPLGHVTREILERSTVPVLLLPPAYREQLPWERLLVPVSSESEEAFELALRFAHALGLEVHAAHVADPAAESLETETRYADALHHEYPCRLEALLDRAMPHGVPDAVERLEDLALCTGEVASELLGLVEKKRPSLLVVGWNGRLVGGSAKVLKQLIGSLAIPVLLVKPPARMPFRLKVGDELD